MTTTISKAVLVSFLRQAATIPTNKVLPILQSVCFRGGELYKTNLHASVCMPGVIDMTLPPFVLDERRLVNFVNAAADGGISITQKAKHIELLDESGTLLRLPIEKPDEYPTPEKEFGDPVALPAGFRWCLETGAKFVDPSHTMAGAWYIHVIDGQMYAVDGQVLVRTAAPRELDGSIIPKELALAVSKFPLTGEVVLRQNQNFWLLTDHGGSIIYTFRKPEARQPDFKAIMQVPAAGWVAVDKTDWQAFNDAAVSLATGFAAVTIEGDMRLEMVDADLDINLTKTLAPGVNLPRFKYNAAYMNKALKAIPHSAIELNLTTKTRAYMRIPGIDILLMGLQDNN